MNDARQADGQGEGDGEGVGCGLWVVGEGVGVGEGVSARVERIVVSTNWPLAWPRGCVQAQMEMQTVQKISSKQFRARLLPTVAAA